MQNQSQNVRSKLHVSKQHVYILTGAAREESILKKIIF